MIAPHALLRRCRRVSPLLAAILFLPAAKNECGSPEANAKWNSDVHAFATVLERPGGGVDAEIVLVRRDDGGPDAFIDDARDVSVRVPGGELVTLARASAGHYQASSAADARLAYRPGETYQFRFELPPSGGDDEGDPFVASVDAPSEPVTFAVAEPPEFAGDTARLTWQPASLYAIIEVRDEAGEIAFGTFDFTQPEIGDGTKGARFQSGGSYTLSADVFKATGRYTVRVCAGNKVSDWDKELSSNLNWVSGMLVGRCAADQTVDVPR
ncbi:MAG TPA: hypothetical protein VFS43_12915 [Polyangiaceae bacterium]|nr:hypothetical protein [Polyangiaceae bacterium]